MDGGPGLAAPTPCSFGMTRKPGPDHLEGQTSCLRMQRE